VDRQRSEDHRESITRRFFNVPHSILIPLTLFSNSPDISSPSIIAVSDFKEARIIFSPRRFVFS